MTSRKTPAKETSHHNRENEDNLDDDRMSSKRRNLSALVFLTNLITKVNLIRNLNSLN